MSTTQWNKIARGIYRNTSDGRIKLRLHSPRQAERTLPAGTPLPEAKAALAALRSELAAEQATTACSTSLEDYARDWLVSQKSRLRASTYTTYKSSIDHQIVPRLGRLTCSSITRAHVQGLVEAFDAATRPDGSSYSFETRRSWWRVAKQMLKDMAADQGRLDPTVRVKPPRRCAGGNQRETRTLTAAQLRALVRGAQELFPDRYPEIATLAFSGLRAGELYALRFEDVDLERRSLYVRHSVSRGEVNETKTGDPRLVVVPGLVTAAIRDHRKRMMAGDHPGLDSGLVFPSDVGSHRVANSLRKPLELLRERLALDVHLSPQVLRRTYNTLLVAAGIDRIVLRAMMGHTTEAMTGRYAGIGYDLKDQAASTLEQLVGKEAHR